MSLHRARSTMRISLPPRLSYTWSQQALPSDLAKVHAENGAQLDKLAVAGVKRARADDVDTLDAEWTEEEAGVVQSTLLHPYRPLKTTYPPGELPPSDVLDDLASQILAFAYPDRVWPYSWDTTRKKLFQVALAESKLGHGQDVDRKNGRDRTLRPGLRRMDSMDFLDDREDEDADAGRTLRLSTSLQNSAKLDAATRLSRASSPVSEPGASHDASVVLTVTPASPDTAPPVLRRNKSFRALSRSARPSLLQRGRSFTADDLAAEAEKEKETIEAIKASPASPVADKTKDPIRSLSPRVTRSASSSALIPSHPVRDLFMTHEPSTKDRCVLAMPLSISPKSTPKPTNGWSDSEDEGYVRQTRIVKKSRGPRAKPKALIEASAMGTGGALRSPFDEKAGFSF